MIVLTAVAIYQLKTNFSGDMKQNKRTTRMPIRFDIKIIYLSVILDKIKKLLSVLMWDGKEQDYSLLIQKYISTMGICVQAI